MSHTICNRQIVFRWGALFYSLFSILYSLFSILYSLFSILYSLFSILYSLSSIPYSLFSVPCSLFLVLSSLFSILYSYSLLFQFPERLAHPPPSRLQIFWQHARLAHGGHKVGVAGPARHGVQMQVPGHARAGGLANIHAEVESMRLVDPLQRALRQLRQVHQFVRSLRRAAPPAGQDARRASPSRVPRCTGKAFRQMKQCFPRRTSPPAASALFAVHAIRNRVVNRGDQIAEDAAQIARPRVQRRGNAGPHRASPPR